MKILQLINRFDKISHFVIGFIMSIFGININLAFSIMVGKEVVDYHFRKTGFDLADLFSGIGGYLLGIYVRNLIIKI